ncbi:MAG: hypothetical protein H7Z42_22300, partial [Roseiflexaceae bacterium]|nr:hypothetical protein [Roseiflexaceae bacterium]
ALHGNNASLAAAHQWGLAREHGYLVALAQSSQIIASHTYNWDDWQRATAEIQQHIAELQQEYAVDPGRIVPGGFSMSGGLVAWLALSGEIETAGFVAVGPHIPDFQRFADLFAAGAQRSIRGYIVIGERDPGLAAAQQLRDLMRQHGLICEFNQIPDLGHDFPPDWAEQLAQALASLQRSVT